MRFGALLIILVLYLNIILSGCYNTTKEKIGNETKTHNNIIKSAIYNISNESLGRKDSGKASAVVKSKDIYKNPEHKRLNNLPNQILSNLSIKAFRTGLSWYWYLGKDIIDNLNLSYDAYDLDLEYINLSIIKYLHKHNKLVICYFSAGTYEEFRPYADRFPKEIIGNKLESWKDESWLNIRDYDKFKDIISSLLTSAKEKGCDGVEADNVDAFINHNGFNLSYNDQLRYNLWLSEQAHKLGLAIGLKNDIEQIKDLVKYFDFAINEQCFQYDECTNLMEFTKRNKAVFGVEYNLGTKEFCSKAKQLNFSFYTANYNLDGGLWRCES
jgi:hypothetical protein